VKNKVLHSVLSVVLIAIMLLPFTIQMVHSLHHHEYIICNAKGDIKHFHQNKIDCSSYHQIIEQNSIDFSSEFKLKISSLFNQNPTYSHQSLYTVVLQLKSSRAPPYFIV